MEETIRKIKQDLHANMNGVASARMRESGLHYHVNFGIELPRIQDIAKQYTPNHELAQQLWHENVRESKILAAILMPTDRFTPDLADIWASQITNAELAQYTTMLLFARLPYATDIAFLWIASPKEMLQLCGFLLIGRLLIQGVLFNERSLQELHDQATSLLDSPNLHLRKAVSNVLLRIKETNNISET